MRRRSFASGLCFMLMCNVFIPISVGFNVKVSKIEQPSNICNGNTLYVGGSGPNNYSTIWRALSDAVDGDTLFVYDDSSPYYEKLIIRKSINLVGEDRNTTIIDGNKRDIGIQIETENVKIKRFTIKNFNQFGIKILSNNATIDENIFTNISGEGIAAFDSHYHIITNNLINSTSVGIRLNKSNKSYIKNNTVSNAYFGLVVGSYRSIIMRNIIKNNKIGIIILLNENQIQNNTISDNYQQGISLRSEANNTFISGNIINNNGDYSTWLCCGIEMYSSYNIVFYNIISNNNGTGIHNFGDNNHITKNKISKNKEFGVFIIGEYNYVTNNIISNNDDVGIYIGWSGYKNNILKNNFIENGVSSYFNSYYFLRYKNIWNRNYWDDNNGRRLYFIRGIVCLVLINSYLDFPWFNIDWHPAKEPYDI